MKKTLCGQEKFLSVQLFLLDRKLRRISYQAKSAPRDAHSREEEICRRRRILLRRILFSDPKKSKSQVKTYELAEN